MSLTKLLNDVDSAIEEKIAELLETKAVNPVDSEGNILGPNKMLDLRMFSLSNGVQDPFRIEILLDGYQVQFIDTEKAYDERCMQTSLAYILENYRDELVEALDVIDSDIEMPMSDMDIAIKKLTDAINNNEADANLTVEQVENWVGCDTPIGEVYEFLAEVKNGDDNAVTSADILDLWDEE